MRYITSSSASGALIGPWLVKCIEAHSRSRSQEGVPIMNNATAQTYERRLLTPQRSWHVKRTNITSAKSLKISENEQDIYSVSVHPSTFKSKTTISILKAGSSKGPVISAAQLNSKELDFTIVLGDPEANESPSMKVEVDLDAGMLDRNFKFQIDGQLYAWQCTGRHFIRIPSADGQGIAEETNGEDWKLIKLSAAKPQMDDQILAVYIRQRKISSLHGDSGAASLYWFESVPDAVERASLAAIMGTLEREKKAAKEYSSGTSLLFG